MFDPTLNVRRKKESAEQKSALRKGAIMPLFAFLLPVLLILSGFAINMAYMQKVSTELKIATDAAAHAGGRAMSLVQTTDAAIAQAELTAQTNKVGGQIIQVSADESEEDQLQVLFGLSTRSNNGYGMYEFTEVAKSAIDSGASRATSVAVVSRVDLPLVFQVMNYQYFGGHMTDFTAQRRSIATQVDRDIALVLDRSGSMLYYVDEVALTNMFTTLYNTYDSVVTPGYYKYHYWKWNNSKNKWVNQGYWKTSDAQSSWVIRDNTDTQYVDPVTTQVRRISSTEKSNATQFLYDRSYSDNVIYQLERWFNEFHTLGSSFSSSESAQLTTEMAQYCRDWEYATSLAPRHSLWYFLDLGVTAFLDILELTDQEERVSLVTFSSTSRLDYGLQLTYENIRTKVSTIMPYGGTAIGDGMLDGLPPIISGQYARPFAAKTIVVLTDGENNAGEDPEAAVQEIIGSHNVTIHTVTFGEGDKSTMQAVAIAGSGRHYHADEGEALVDIFEEIANNLPTILTE